VIPRQEINSKERDKFWEKEEQEEKQRQAEERKRKEEERNMLENERKQREVSCLISSRSYNFHPQLTCSN
jgi:hypothetical protein